MKHLIKTIIIALLSTFLFTSVSNATIQRQTVEWLFQSAKKDGKMNLKDKCLWGYFFVDKRKNRLKKAARILQNQGFRYVRILGPSESKDGIPRYILHIEKVEKHTVNSLMRRNNRFYRFVSKYKIESYDGMDVGKPKNGGC